MARFFVSASNIFGGVAYLSGRDAEHIRVLRIRRGETFTVCDGAGTDYTCRLTKNDGEGVEAEILGKSPSSGEPSVDCTVYAAFSKGDRPDFTVQKCVEMGASGIVFFPSARCVAKHDGVSLIKKLNRWQKIAEEAAKQCGRGKVPEIKAAPGFDSAVKSAAAADVPLFLYELEQSLSLKAALEEKPGFKTVSIVTGPEGGFEPEEASAAVDAGMRSVTVGKRILRCETAPMCALAGVLFFTGDM